MGYWLFHIQHWHDGTPIPSNRRGTIYYQGYWG